MSDAASFVDLTSILFTLFWLFFIGLVLHLHREGKREGWPLQLNNGETARGVGGIPQPKTYRKAHGQGDRVRPGPDAPEYAINAEPLYNANGAPLKPLGDPMVDGLGPAAWATRAEQPDLTVDGRPRIVPLRVDPEHSVVSNDPNPIGKAVFGCDGAQAGTVVDLWVDRAEPMFRYAELDVAGKRVLLPMTMARVSKSGEVNVRSIRSDQFQQVPTLANPDQITLQEEDKIVAFYGGGTLYAIPSRQEPRI